MKTSAELQQQSFFRKLTYFGLILVLFTVMTFSGRAVKMVSGAPSRWTVTDQARSLQLNESEQGEADVAGSTIRLATSGVRGFAITIFWLGTIESQKKHEWNEVEFLVDTITKLQPHFLTPWLFQSWNLAYNVSVESDRVRDKYFYISRGIELLADGERINRARGVDRNGEYELGNPDMRFWIGFYYMNKFGTSDEQHTLRSLLQMSCISPAKRDPKLLRRDRRTVDRQAFREFVQQNPLLCRRLRDHLRCNRPEDVVDFLADNAKVPGRYEEIEGNWVLKKPELQFPVLPKDEATRETASPFLEFGGNFDSFHCSWAWSVFSQEPLPPVEKGKPAAGVPPYDPLRYRMPRSPASIIFRQYPPRNLSYIAERLQKEGWFDDTGWEVDAGRQTDLWFPDEKLIVGNEPRYSSKLAWQRAAQNWETHGLDNGLLLSEQTKRNLYSDAEKYCATYNVPRDAAGPRLERDQVSEEMWQSYDAHSQLNNLAINLHLTNFRHFLYTAQAESDDRTVRMRRLMFEALRLRSAPKQAIRKYEQAFAALTGDPATGRQGILEAYPEFRRDSTTQEDLYEVNLRYLRLLQEEQGPAMRTIVTGTNLIGSGALGASAPGMFSGLLYEFFPRSRELPSLFVGPLDGVDSKEDPWVSLQNAYSVKLRLGLVKVVADVPANAPSPSGLSPAGRGR